MKNIGNTIHGEHNTLLYKKWKSMRGRVLNHKHYLANKIECCEEWNSYVLFRDWSLNNGYKDGLSLDRIDTYKGYSPDNCRWVTRTTQSENIRIRKDNTTGYSGVSLDKISGKYKVQIQVDGKKIYLGRFLTAIEGAIAFDRYVKENNTKHTLNFGGHYDS